MGLMQRLSEEDKENLAVRFAADGGNVDYVSCFREYLTTFAEQSMMRSMSASGITRFQGYQHNHRKAAKPLHPWEFEYRREYNTFNPYIPNMNLHKKLTLLDHARAKTFPIIVHPKEPEKETAALLLKFEAKILSICKKCANFLPLMDTKYLEHEFRSCEGRAMRNGVISAKSFQSVLRSYCKMLSSIEMGSLLRAFRVSSKEKDVNYHTFLEVCAAMKDINF